MSIVIPYYESKNTIDLVLSSLIEAVSFVKRHRSDWEAELIVVDDGSIKHPANKEILSEFIGLLSVKTLPANRGRFYSRNKGLKIAKGDLVMFIDSDVVVPKELIFSHLKIHGKARLEGRNCISFSLFNFVEYLDFSRATNKNQFFDSCNDFRNRCVYQASWIGCEEDKRFIGKEFKILEDTDYLRAWPNGGFFGPWTITNMVLGGLFIVGRDEAIKVNGCSAMFGLYGFEETSLVTKIIAKFGSYVIPETNSYAIHITDPGSSISRHERDFLFQKTHDIYFNKYLNLSLENAINEKM